METAYVIGYWNGRFFTMKSMGESEVEEFKKKWKIEFVLMKEDFMQGLGDLI